MFRTLGERLLNLYALRQTGRIDMLSYKVMVVDDDTEILKSFKRRYSKTFSIDTFEKPEQALLHVTGPESYAAVVSDYRMPVMNGVAFLSRVRDLSPLTIRILLTGYADLKTSLDAVNKSNIFRMLTKPCPSDIMNKALADALRQHQLVLAEQELLNKTLMGTVEVMSEMLSIAKPDAFGKSTRIRHLSRQIAASLNVSELWEIEIAAALSQLGLLAFPDDLVRKIIDGDSLTDLEKNTCNDHPKMAANLLRHIPRLEKVSEMVAFQEKGFDGSGFPRDDRQGEDLPLGARILKAAIDFDVLTRKKPGKSAALAAMKDHQEKYDDSVFQALIQIVSQETTGRVKKLLVQDLTEKLVAVQDIYSMGKKRKLLSAGHELTLNIIECLEKIHLSEGVEEPVFVMEPDEE